MLDPILAVKAVEASEGIEESSENTSTITLPELTGHLVIAEAEGKPLEDFLLPFVNLHAIHLLSLIKMPSRTIYNIYCRKIVEKYPCFSDNGACSNGELTWVYTNSFHINF